MVKELRDVIIQGMIGKERVSFSTCDELLIDRGNLDEELARHSAHHASICVLYERAKGQRLCLEAEIEELEADLSNRIREKAKKDLTETAIRQAVVIDKKRRELRERWVEADQIEREMSALVYGMMHRKDTLVSLTAGRNLELSVPSAADVDAVRRLHGIKMRR